ncbi:MAG TPA: His/Gly/Thr/Pro-type tRNA ligase C-terminal domain-containing protein [Candidatus Nanoarchaeia archaeon]|nr:His/Gly/Thr/Pro-type tRNA ligase C-terminal domain-containing protein [Candidatus Nanoarchaeia archaeon]
MSLRIKVSSREPGYVLKDLDKAAEISLFYGFQPIKTPKIEKVDLDHAQSIAPQPQQDIKNVFPRAEEKISLLRSLLAWNLESTASPTMLHYKRPLSRIALKQAADELSYSLDIVNSIESVSEAIAIRTAVAILADHGHNKVIVDINSLGDKHSMTQFEKELQNFSRKHGSTMPPEVKQQLKKDPFECLRCDHEKWKEIRERAPQSLSYLSEQSIEHFQQVLEYLETLDIPYRINPRLIGQRHYCSHTVFEIKSAHETEGAPDETLAVGTRHNYIAKRIGYKKETPLVSVNLHFKKTGASPKLFFKNQPQPKFFFIQFGQIARLKSLGVIESLRQARIPVHHQLNSNKFVGQLTAAESLKTPFVIIMGQKEALENTVVVRHMPTRSQEIVSIPQLAIYLSRLKS